MYKRQPSYFEDGNLYLWVPEATKGKTISVSCKHNGKPLEPLYIEDTKNDGTAVLKRYVDFELPKEFINNLTKPYDGISFDTYDFEKEGNAIEAVDQSGNSKTLNKNDSVVVILQRYDKVDGKPIEEDVYKRQIHLNLSFSFHSKSIIFHFCDYLFYFRCRFI